MRDLLAAVLALLTAALLAGIWLQAPGVNGPREWRWEYRPAGFPGETGPPAKPVPGRPGSGGGSEAPGIGGAPAWTALAALCLLIGAVTLRPSAAKIEPEARPSPPPSAPAAGSRRRLALLLAAGLALTLVLAAAQPGGFGRVMDIMASRNGFGYLWDAGLAPGTRELLAHYPQAATALNQHSVTHPPGPILAVRAVDRITRGWPAAGAEDGGLGGAAARSLAREVSRAHAHGRPLPQRLPGPWTAVLLALLLPALSALAAWPLAGLGRGLGLGEAEVRLAAGLWLLVPARSLFTPSFDQALPCLLLAAAWLAAKRPAWCALAAGLLAWVACFISYGCLTLLPLIAWIAWLSAARLAGHPRERQDPDSGDRSGNDPGDPPEEPRPAPSSSWRWWASSQGAGLASPAALRGAILIAMGSLLPWAILALATGFNPWAAFRSALALHHLIAVAPRGYATWLAWNPYDFALLTGLPVLVLALVLLRPGRDASPVPRALRAMGWLWWALLALLVLSGGVRGEVGRIWLPWMPFGCLFAAAAVNARWGESPQARGALLLAQAALTLSLAANMVFMS